VLGLAPGEHRDRAAGTGDAARLLQGVNRVGGVLERGEAGDDRAASSSSPASALASPGSAAITASQLDSSASPPSSSGAQSANASTTRGSNWPPERSRATATAASTPSPCWTSTTEDTWTSRIAKGSCSPPAPAGIPLPSQREKTWSSGSCTSGPSPRRRAIADATWQWAVSASAAPRPRRTAGADPAQQEAHHRQAREVDPMGVRTQRQVVAELAQ
jgi:hypothetical protein